MPEVILLSDVESLGGKGDVVDVSKGYLRNYLVPRKLAAPATKGAVESAARRVAEEERQRRELTSKAHEHADLLNRTVLTLSAKAGEDGRLFGSITNQDIVDAIKEARGITIDKRNVHLGDAIKNVGTYQVMVEVVNGVTASVKTMVTEAK